MNDRFDAAMRAPHLPPVQGSIGDARARHRTAAARLVSRLYRSASEPLRADMLACLLRPLGTLSLVGVASGAFARLLHRDGVALDRVAAEDVARYSSAQILELAHFVHEVDPGTLLQLAALPSDSALGVTALSATALVLLYRRFRSASAASSGP